MNDTTSPPPLPASSQPQTRAVWTAAKIGGIARMVLQLLLSVPGVVILPFIFMGIGAPGIYEVLHGHRLGIVPAAIGLLYLAGFVLVTVSIFLPSQARRRAFLIPLSGAVLFATCAFLLYTKAHWGGDSRQPHREQLEIAGMFAGTVLVGLWNAIRCVKTLK
jgi:hypothetical protein